MAARRDSRDNGRTVRCPGVFGMLVASNNRGGFAGSEQFPRLRTLLTLRRS